MPLASGTRLGPHGIVFPRWVLIVVAVLLLAGAGCRSIIGVIRYDQRKEGPLKVGDAAPDIELVALDGTTPVRLKQHLGGKPLVIIFGSYT